MEYDSTKINELANKISISDYIESQGITCAKENNGTKYYHCHNNSDSDASLAVNTKENYFYCFSCTSRGNLVSYMLQEEHMTFLQACEKILSLSGIDISKMIIPDSMSFFNKIKNEKKEKVNDKVRQYMPWSEYEKFSDEPIKPWIEEGITEETQKLFQVRVDHRSNRGVYPLWDSDLRFISCKGRTLFPQFKELGLPKYISYTKIGDVDFFCGWKENKENILKNNTIIIFEGIKSVMKAYQYGYKICVSSETSALNNKQVQLLLKLGIKNVVLAYDKDKTYQDVIKHIGMLPRFCNVSVIIDKGNLLGMKDSPCDKGQQVWNELYQNRWRIG